MRYKYEFAANGDDGHYNVFDADDEIVAKCRSEDAASDVCAALNREDDAQLVLDTFINKAVDAVEKYGLSRVSHAGSLKSDEAWGVIEILGREIERLRDRNAKLFRRARLEADLGSTSGIVYLECQCCGACHSVFGKDYKQGLFDSEGFGPKNWPTQYPVRKRDL